MREVSMRVRSVTKKKPVAMSVRRRKAFDEETRQLARDLVDEQIDEFIEELWS
jgi:hypothetical protein